jgi:xylulokinase
MKNKNSSSEYLMAIDLGTSAVKVAIFDTDGFQKTIESAEYRLSYPGKDFVENDVNKYWDCIVSLIKKTLESLENDPAKILAISISSQGETIIPVDSKCKPLMPAIVWLDNRSAVQAKEIEMDFGADTLFNITGMPYSDPAWPASKIKWLKENNPDIFKATSKYLLIEDYITYKLTGTIVGENTVYSSSYYYDFINKKYYQPMLDYLNIGQKQLPQIISPGNFVANISRAASHETGLSTSTRFIMGSVDQIAGAIGAGNIRPGILTETTGTALAMVVMTDKPVIDYKNRIPCLNYVMTDKYCLLPYSMTGGAVLKWFKDNFYILEEKQITGGDIYAYIDKEASEIKAGCDGLITLPHLSGAFLPYNNPDARGVFYGVGLNHSRKHFSRSIMESIAFTLKGNIELLERADIKIDKILSLGGGAKSSLWSQIKADIIGKDINIPQNTETSVLGAAIIAGVGTGIYTDYEEAVRKFVKIEKKFTPAIKNKEVYDECYAKFNDIFLSLEKTH